LVIIIIFKEYLKPAFVQVLRSADSPVFAQCDIVTDTLYFIEPISGPILARSPPDDVANPNV